MAMYKKIRWVAVLALVMVLMSGCSLFNLRGQSKSIDPPPAGANDAMDSASLAASAGVDSTVGTTGTSQVTMYFKDANGYVVPLSMRIPSKDGIAQESLAYMVDGGPETVDLPQGFTPLLPKGTVVNGINLIQDQQLAVVDFNAAFAKYNAVDERKILEAVVWTLTGFPSVDNVQFRIAGKDITEMPVADTPLDQPMSRSMGINLEIAPGVSVGQSTAVTLYFAGQTNDHFNYLVPVTRMIDRTDSSQITNAVLNQLLIGPDQSNGLTAAVDPNAKVLSVNQANDNSLITVDFSNQIVNADATASAQALEAVVMSLTQDTGAAQVQILVNGKKKAIIAGNQNYTYPVDGSIHVNQFKM